jgi:hypothetical protein
MKITIAFALAALLLAAAGCAGPRGGVADTDYEGVTTVNSAATSSDYSGHGSGDYPAALAEPGF